MLGGANVDAKKTREAAVAGLARLHADDPYLPYFERVSSYGAGSVLKNSHMPARR